MSAESDLFKLPVLELSRSLQDHTASISDLAANYVIHCAINKLHAVIKPVGIIGAGAAGLYAAMILQDLGIEYEILEANDRIGGRIFTHRFNGEAGRHAPKNTPERYDYFDVGAMRFPDIPFMNRVFDLIRRVRVDDLLVDYHLGVGNNLAYYNTRGPFRKSDIRPKSDPFGVSIASGGTVPEKYALAGTQSWISKTFDPFRDLFREAYEGQNEEDRFYAFEKAWKTLMEQDHHTTRGYMQTQKEDQAPFPEPVVNWLETFHAGTGTYNAAFTESVMSSLNFNWPWPHLDPPSTPNAQITKWYCIDGGSDHIVYKMADALESEPILKQRVTKMEKRGNRIVVTGVDTGGVRQWKRRYDQVICTVPLGCLGAIDTDGLGLLYNHKQAIRALQYHSSTKVGIKFKERWWEKAGVNQVIPTGPIRGGQSSTDTQIRTCVYPSYGLYTLDAPGVLIASYTTAQDSRRIGVLAQDKGSVAGEMLLEQTLDELAKMHGISKKQFGPVEDYFAHNWDTDVFARARSRIMGLGSSGHRATMGGCLPALKHPLGAAGSILLARRRRCTMGGSWAR
ncbi:hypothetical protein EVG20_g8079 [Dentipellis fragilis]|uniref:Amine oxidase domain-containing protein n=1 Tax=Dentipellis fragilis TaxID=205917 RepID=A0A4Y9YAM7_9AGAM|nr:hypothetical protein EVG20_g8079 [Dentipellis fragilis]